MQTTSVQTVSLYFKQGSSDKEYHASIELQNGGYVVNYSYGRRGTTLQTGTKTKVPLDLETANKVLAKLIAEKKAKGYTEGEAGNPYQHTQNENRVTEACRNCSTPLMNLKLSS
jgi:bifunctional non-homologous end joining protein LigD